MITKESDPEGWKTLRKLVGPGSDPEYYIPDEILGLVFEVLYKADLKVHIIQALRALAIAAVIIDSDDTHMGLADINGKSRKALNEAAYSFLEKAPDTISVDGHAQIPWEKFKETVGLCGGEDLPSDSLLLRAIEMYEYMLNKTQRKQFTRTIDVLGIWDDEGVTA